MEQARDQFASVWYRQGEWSLNTMSDSVVKTGREYIVDDDVVSWHWTKSAIRTTTALMSTELKY